MASRLHRRSGASWGGDAPVAGFRPLGTTDHTDVADPGRSIREIRVIRGDEGLFFRSSQRAQRTPSLYSLRVLL
jgi:hypothetical protein